MAMINSYDDEREMMCYLLGELSLEEKMRVEERYLMEGDYFERLQDVEDELIHKYVLNKLAGRERELFEKHYLSIPQNREKVKRAKALKTYLNSVRPQEESATIKQPNKAVSWVKTFADFLTPKTTGLKLGYALAMAAMIFFVTTQVIESNRLKRQATQFEGERQLFLQKEQEWQQQVEAESKQRDELAAQLQQEQNRRVMSEKEISQQRLTKGVPFTIMLKPGVSRSAQDANKLNLAQIKRQEPLLEIQLLLEDPRAYESYRVFLVTASEDTVLIKYGLQAQKIEKGKALILQLPTSDLSDDEYQITVKGVTASREIEHVDSYQLSVKKE